MWLIALSKWLGFFFGGGGGKGLYITVQKTREDISYTKKIYKVVSS